MINHFTKLLYHFYWSHVIKKVKQAIHTYVSIQCSTCCVTLLLYYTCHTTTLLPCFKTWEIHVSLLCCTTTIHKQSSTKQTKYANVSYVCFRENDMMRQMMHMFMRRNAISRSQTPRVLQPSPLRKISSRDLESVPISIESWIVFL